MGNFGRGAVAGGHEETVAAAAQLLEAGGNAFDAAVAGQLAACVAEPMLTSLGGGGFLLARTASGEARLFDFFVDTPGRGLPEALLEPHFLPVTVRFPGAEQVFNVGRGSVAVPGVLAGLMAVHDRLGRAPWADVVEPAARIAEQGLVQGEMQAYTLELLDPILRSAPGALALYGKPDGSLPGRGERWACPEFAAFLRGLPGSGESLYRGALAVQIAQDMADGGGLLTAEDLAHYTVIERSPLALPYRDHTLLCNPPPSFGGGLIGLALALLEPGPSAGAGSDGAEAICRLAAAGREVSARRAAGALGVEDLDADTLALARGEIRRFSRGTTHLSVADADGNVASLTTSNGEGSGYIVPGTGIQLNNMMGEDDLHPDGFHAAPPGERVRSMMAPSILLRGDAVEAVLGSGGSKRIRSAVLQVATGLIDHGLQLAEAVEAPRVHWEHGRLHVEPGLPEDTMRALRADFPVNAWDHRDLYFGGVHAIRAARGERAVSAHADPRRFGAARVL